MPYSIVRVQGGGHCFTEILRCEAYILSCKACLEMLSDWHSPYTTIHGIE